jgi:DNA-binding response OmpR family regulator
MKFVNGVKMKSSTILVIEDEKQIARIIELELMHEGYTVEIAYNGNEGLEKVQKNEPDLILLDIMLPGLNGIEVCEKIRRFSQLPIIMLTAKDELSFKVIGLDTGANDYLTKPFEMEELLARIRAALRISREHLKPTKQIILDNLIVDLTKHTVTRGETEITLTKKEFNLLEYMMRNKGIILTREQILDNVWGIDFCGDANIVDVFIKYLRDKVDFYNSKLIHTVRGFGYVMEKRND